MYPLITIGLPKIGKTYRLKEKYNKVFLVYWGDVIFTMVVGENYKWKPSKFPIRRTLNEVGFHF